MLLLTTPISVGDADSQPYTHIRIRRLVWDDELKKFELYCRAGYLQESEFVPGVEIPDVTTKIVHVANIHVESADAEVVDNRYDELVAKLTSASGVLIYDEVAREAYQYLIDKNEFAGTVE